MVDASINQYTVLPHKTIQSTPISIECSNYRPGGVTCGSGGIPLCAKPGDNATFGPSNICKENNNLSNARLTSRLKELRGSSRIKFATENECTK